MRAENLKTSGNASILPVFLHLSWTFSLQLQNGKNGSEIVHEYKVILAHFVYWQQNCSNKKSWFFLFK